MTTDENIMEEMLERATNPRDGTADELSLQIFCMVVRRNPILVFKAQEMIMLKVRSNNIAESTRALSLLEECMIKCGAEFQEEASKFRFLNQLILLASHKHQGPTTPKPIKQRILQCLLLWTTEFPQKTKIREVYEMLCKEEELELANSPAVEPKRESVLGIDEERLSKLIKSNDPENFKRANLLIQSRVKQDSRRMDVINQHKSILLEVQNTVSLLDQMLNTYESGEMKGDNESETLSLMRELYHSCKQHKPIVERLPALMATFDESLILDAVANNDGLQNVIKRYKNLLSTAKKTSHTAIDSSKSSAAVAVNQLKNNVNLLSDFLGNESGLDGVSSSRDGELLDMVPKITTLNPLDELDSIFSSGIVENTVKPSIPNSANNVFSELSILEPSTVFPSSAGAEAINTNKTIVEANAPEKRAFRELPAIDQLSEDLFKASLQDLERVGSFKKEAEKCTLNDMAKEKLQPFRNVTESADRQNPALQKIADIFGRNPQEEDEVSLLPIHTDAGNNVADTLDDHEKCETENYGENTVAELPTKHLSDIVIDLDDVIPATGDRLLLDDDDMKLMLNFTKNRPSMYVSVLVISASNKSKLPVYDFLLEASVRKPCKVRLMQPTGVAMSPYKPYRPAIPINQIMLLFNPTGKPVDVTCILGYRLGDDPDAIKESIVAKAIPFVK